MQVGKWLIITWLKIAFCCEKNRMGLGTNRFLGDKPFWDGNCFCYLGSTSPTLSSLILHIPPEAFPLLSGPSSAWWKTRDCPMTKPAPLLALMYLRSCLTQRTETFSGVQSSVLSRLTWCELWGSHYRMMLSWALRRSEWQNRRKYPLSLES